MPADALHISIIAAELNSALGGGRIDKITMPEPDEIVLFVHSSARHALILSANPSLPRVHLSDRAPKNNPLNAPAFLMHLRKHIGGAVIQSVSSMHGERILFFKLKARGDLGYEEDKTLVCEILGKYANVILCDESGKISECIKHISPASSEKRPVLPGLKYCAPPPQNKIDVFDKEAFSNLLNKFEGGNLSGYILAGAAGLAPATIKAITEKTLGGVYFDSLDSEQKEKLCAAFDFDSLANNLRPCIRRGDDGKSDFWLAPFSDGGEYEYFPTLNKAMDEYYFALDRDRRIQEKGHVPKTVVRNAIARAEKKRKLFLTRKEEASDAEHDRLCGELIIANIYKIKQGMKTLEAENYYENPPQNIVIALDASKSPQYNAQMYFKRYAKKKKTLSMVEDQIAQTEADIEYYNSVLDSFAYTDEEGLEEIISELAAANLIREQKSKKKKEKLAAGGELKYKNCVIRWGKTNTQNDRVTKSARADDLWLHTQKTHGSHVTVSGEQIDQSVIIRAAQIAAYYSKARLADNVAVDYTLKKFVSKPKGGAPGKAIYTDYKTVFVTPKDERE